MIRLHVIAEGPTEENFATRVLRPHLANMDIHLDARSVMTSQDRRTGYVHRGGLRRYGKLKADLHLWMKQDNHPECWFTTMVDLYGLPSDFPGFANASHCLTPRARVAHLEQAFAQDIGHLRFAPYIQLHEFEALLFCDPSSFADLFPEAKSAVQHLVDIAASVGSPEDIDDGAQTAPSKRILAKIPEYGDEKPRAGPLIAEDIGLAQMRAKCPHFNEWLTKLEALAKPHSP